MNWLSLQWRRGREVRFVYPARSANLQVLKLQNAKEILVDIFLARPE